LRLAAEQGHARAQFAVGLGYNNGVGVPRNNAEALKWYRRSADQGHPAAQFFLGLMYWSGEGVPRDFVQAYMWFNLAAACDLCEAYPDANGASPNAAESRERVARDMTVAQIADAQKMASDWRPKPER
jgi:hypothetical protein